jgi:hypothetical protein
MNTPTIVRVCSDIPGNRYASWTTPLPEVGTYFMVEAVPCDNCTRGMVPPKEPPKPWRGETYADRCPSCYGLGYVPKHGTIGMAHARDVAATYPLCLAVDGEPGAWWLAIPIDEPCGDTVDGPCDCGLCR